MKNHRLGRWVPFFMNWLPRLLFTQQGGDEAWRDHTVTVSVPSWMSCSGRIENKALSLIVQQGAKMLFYSSSKMALAGDISWAASL